MRYLFASLLLLLGGCASDVPQSLRTEVASPLSVARVQADPQGTRGHPVRWGGEILSLSNARDHTDVVVLRHGLFGNGEPRPEGGEARRFVARIRGFLDPADYRPGQRLTVSGRVRGVRMIRVGEYPYPHPVVEVTEYHRWPPFVPVPEPPWHRDPFYCDPWPFPFSPYPRPFCW